MSFQTFNLFNFFQQPNTGKHKILDTNEINTATSPTENTKGAVADFNWFFPYANKIIPNAIILGGSPFPLFSDAYETSEIEGESVFGVRHPKVKINLYGDFYKDINKASVRISFLGYLFPKDLHEQNINLFISGLVSGEPPDIISSEFNLSGQTLEAKHEYYNINIKNSGDFLKIFYDFPDIKIDFSGIIESGNIDFPIVENKISGIFSPIYKDFSEIEYYLSDFYTGKGFGYIDRVFEDEISNLTYSLDLYVSASS